MKKLTLALSVAVLTLGLSGAGQAIYAREVADELKSTQDAYQQTQASLQQAKLVQQESQNQVQTLREQLLAEKEKSSIIQNDLQEEVKKLKEQMKANQREVSVKPKSPQLLASKKPSRTSLQAAKTIRMVGTAYTANDAGMNGRGKTATGTHVKQGRTISVDPRVIPLGSKVYITSKSFPEMNGVYTAEDTGSAIKGNKIDVYYKTRKDALRFGKRKDLVVRILKES
ncbi:Cell wall-binding protein YocH precursor [compost metagenome]